MKISEWKLKFTENVSDKLKRINKLSDEAKVRMNGLQEKLASSNSKVGSSVSNLVDGLKNKTTGFIESMTGMSGNLSSLLTNPYILATAAAVAFGAKATGMAMQFEQGMAKVNATAQLPKEGLADLRKQLIDIGRNSAADMDQLPQSFDAILSRTNNVKVSMDVMKAAIKGADSGFADLDTVSGALAQTMNLVSKEGLNAGQVLDTYMAAKRVGAGEFKDFAQYMPQLIAAGNNLGVTFNNTAGTFAYMTSMGQSAADSAMMMENLYAMLGRGEIQKNIKAIADVDIFDAQGQMRNLDAIFGELSGKMAGMSDQAKSNLIESFGIKDMQAKSAFSVMLTDSEKLKSTMEQVANASGEADRTMTATANPMRTMAEIGNQFKGFMLDIGYEILPYVSEALSYVADGLKWAIAYVKDWWSHASILKDLLWLVGKVLGWVWDAVVGIGKAFMWVVDHTIKPIYDGINWIYDKLKEILGFGGEEVAIKATVVDETKDANNALGGGKKGSLANGTGGINAKAQKGIDGVSGGGTQTRNVIINMNNNFNIKAANLKESMAEVKRVAIQTVVEIAQGAELTLAN